MFAQRYGWGPEKIAKMSMYQLHLYSQSEVKPTIGGLDEDLVWSIPHGI